LLVRISIFLIKPKIKSLVLPPKSIDCTPYYPNLTNQTLIEPNETDPNLQRVLINGQIRKIEPMYNYSREYGRSVLTDVRILISIVI
jgi:hypothetical protein